MKVKAQTLKVGQQYMEYGSVKTVSDVVEFGSGVMIFTQENKFSVPSSQFASYSLDAEVELV